MAARITTTALPVAFVGTAYSFRIQTADVIGAITWSMTGAPTGFAISASTGVITNANPSTAIVGVFAITVGFTGPGGTDSLVTDLTVRPADYQRIAKLVLDPRLERIVSLFSAVHVTPEQMAAHFNRPIPLPPTPTDQYYYDSYPNTYLADKMIHSADHISYEDLSDTVIDGTTDTRTLREALDDIEASIVLPINENVGGGAGVYASTAGGVNSFRSLTSGQGMTINTAGNVINLAANAAWMAPLDPYMGMMSRSGVPSFSINGYWECGHQARSPNDSYFVNGTSYSHFPFPNHMYPYMTFGALDINGFPHCNHRMLANGSVARDSGFNGYEDGPWLPPNAMNNVTIPFRMTGKFRCHLEDAFIEVVMEPNISLSPPVYSPSPAVDRRMIFHTDIIGQNWTGYNTIELAGTITWTSYQSWSWSGTFNVFSSSGSAIFSKTVGGSGYNNKSPNDPQFFSYRDGALLNVRFRVDGESNLHAWNSYYQGPALSTTTGNSLVFEKFDWNL